MTRHSPVSDPDLSIHQREGEWGCAGLLGALETEL